MDELSTPSSSHGEPHDADPPRGEIEVTRILNEWRSGDRDALAKLTPFVYDELRRLARGYMKGERATHTLQATALVHEVYLRLVGTQDTQWKDRVHFYAIAAQTMRRILVDHARASKAVRRGGGAPRLSLDEAQLPVDEKAPDLVALDEALSALAEFDPQKSRIIELRFFGGLTIEETAEVLNLTSSRVWQETQIAKAWLYDEIENGNIRAG